MATTKLNLELSLSETPLSPQKFQCSKNEFVAVKFHDSMYLEEGKGGGQGRSLTTSDPQLFR
jgi:hypothetical protein